MYYKGLYYFYHYIVSPESYPFNEVIFIVHSHNNGPVMNDIEEAFLRQPIPLTQEITTAEDSVTINAVVKNSHSVDYYFHMSTTQRMQSPAFIS